MPIPKLIAQYSSHDNNARPRKPISDGYMKRRYAPRGCMDAVLASVASHREERRVCLDHAENTRPDVSLTNLVLDMKQSTPAATSVHQLQLMFYTPPPTDYYVNRLVAWATKEATYTSDGHRQLQQFAHVELSFDRDLTGARFAKDTTIGFSIVQKSNVFMVHKTWRAEYVPVTLYVSNEAYRNLFNTCVGLAADGIPFDAFGMYASHFMPSAVLAQRTRKKHGTFCSKIITEVLQEHGIGGAAVAGLCPSTTTPCKLFVTLQSAVLEVNSSRRTAKTRAKDRLF